MDKKSRKHVLGEVFDNRFYAARSNLVVPFVAVTIDEGEDLPKYKNAVLDEIVAQEAAPFEAMVEATIFGAERIAMKAFMEYVAYAAKEWNEQNTDGRHFNIDVNITYRNKNDITAN